jgi:hypothetical protein
MDAEFYTELFDARLGQLHTAMPARVESFDAATQTVDVTPQLKQAYPDGEGGVSYKALPVIPNVKVVFPRSGSFFISFPLAKGDFVLLVFNSRSIQAWRDKGQAVEPGDLALHPLDGAVAIPGLFPDASALNDVSASTMKLGKDGTSAAQIEITASQVKLGGGAQFVALANKVTQWLDAFNAAVDGWTPVPNDGGAALKAALATLTSGIPSTDVGAANVKAT